MRCSGESDSTISATLLSLESLSKGRDLACHLFLHLISGDKQAFLHCRGS